jgi:hypothetical protein
MDHIALNAKAKMGLAEHTVEGGFENRRNFLKALHAADRQTTAALGQCMSAVENLLNALDRVQEAYALLATMGTEHQELLQGVALELGKSVTEVRTAALEPFMANMRTFCVEPVQCLNVDLNECDQLKHNRTKAVDLYDLNRSKVANKEKDYLKKGKPLTESKHYVNSTTKAEEAKKEFEAASTKFNQCCDGLQTKKVIVTAQTLQAFVHGMTSFVENLALSLKRVNSMLQA